MVPSQYPRVYELVTKWPRQSVFLSEKLRNLQSASELYILSDRHLSANFSANCCGEECRVVSAADPHGR
jgi:hypothetical protein